LRVTASKVQGPPKIAAKTLKTSETLVGRSRGQTNSVFLPLNSVSINLKAKFFKKLLKKGLISLTFSLEAEKNALGKQLQLKYRQRP
jgi:hypothetical protein